MHPRLRVHFTLSPKALARLNPMQRLAVEFQEIHMGDNSFLSPAFVILVVGIIAVVVWLVTRAKKKRNKK
ncbi:putative membrane protein [Xanthomonas campestris pv. campestris]|nr:putative membrane protein [Xanthomonas campestris pv. campestris]